MYFNIGLIYVTLGLDILFVVCGDDHIIHYGIHMFHAVVAIDGNDRVVPLFHRGNGNLPLR